MARARAKGTLNPTGRSRSVAIHFDNEIFEMIANEAVQCGRSFGEQVRIYVGRGIDASKKVADANRR